MIRVAEIRTIKDARERIRRLEERNFSRLILAKGRNAKGEEIYNMGGNSVLIYNFMVKPKLKEAEEGKMFAGDFYVKEITKFRRSLERADVLRAEREWLDLFMFELNFFTPEKKLEEFRENFRVEREKREVLKPAVILVPVLYERLRYIQREIFKAVEEMTSLGRDYNGRLILDYARRMIKYYMMINNGFLSAKEGYKKILEINNLLTIELSFAMELKTIPARTAIKLGIELVEVKRGIDMELKKI